MLWKRLLRSSSSNMPRFFRALRFGSLSALIFSHFLFFAAPFAMAQNAQCMLQGECLQGAATDGSCNAKYCFGLGDGKCVNPQGICYVNPPVIDLAVNIGGVAQVQNLGDYIQTIYKYGVSVAGIVAAVTIVIGGFQYMTGNPKEGKSKIYRSLLGVTLVFGAYVILLTINPDLVRLQLPKIPLIKKNVLAACAYTENCFPCGVPYVSLIDKASGTGATGTGQCEFAVSTSATIGARFAVAGNCVGKGCTAKQVTGGTACSSATYRCKSVDANTAFACGTKPTAAIDGYACRQCIPRGQKCNNPGASDECCGGFCTTGNVCANGEPGDSCDEDNECKGNFCAKSVFSSNICSPGAIGNPCEKKEDCKQSGFCSTSGGNLCTAGKQYNYCSNDSECNKAAELVCFDGSTILDGTKLSLCMPKGNFLHGCKTNSDCLNIGGFCNTSYGNVCTDGSPGAPCSADKECANNRCAHDKNICVTGENGSACSDGNDCVSKVCAGSTKRFCSSGGIGSKCVAGPQCLGGLKCIKEICSDKP